MVDRPRGLLCSARWLDSSSISNSWCVSNCWGGVILVRGIVGRSSGSYRTTMLRRLSYHRFVRNRDRDRLQESRLQLLQLGLESAVHLMVLLGTVADDEDMRDLLLDDDSGRPRSRVAPGLCVCVVNEGLDGVQPRRWLGRQDLIGIRPDRLRWRTAFDIRHMFLTRP